MSWKTLLQSVSGSINDHIQLRHEYLMAENRILRNQIDGRVQLTDSERKELAEIGAKLGKQALAEIATVAHPDTILAWYRKFADPQVDTSEPPKSVGRPRMDKEIEDWVIRMARENRSWGYDRIQGGLNHLGYTISDQTVGNILKRHGISPAPERKKTVTWREFIRSHWDVLVATDFFNSEVWNWFGLVMSYLLSVIHFSRLQVQSVMTALRQPVLALRVLVQRALDLSLKMLRSAPHVTRPPQAGRVRDTVLEQIGSEVALVDARQMRSQDKGKLVDFSSARRRPIRHGPIRSRPKPSEPLRDIGRQAA